MEIINQDQYGKDKQIEPVNTVPIPLCKSDYPAA